ncbi:hypothetical protein EBS02_02575, partial [bacterium]|nr:hypothetical protein [bacterium]
LTGSEKSTLTNSLLQTAKSRGIEIDRSKGKEGDILTNFLTNMEKTNQANQAQFSRPSSTYNKGLTDQQFEDLLKLRS